MLDLETMGTSVHAPIIQIGMVYFNMGTGNIGDSYCMNISLQSMIDIGAIVDGATVEWWMFQSEEARRSVFSDPIGDAKSVLREANEFADKAQSIWSHATFDYVILRESLRKAGVHPTFNYRTAKDIRTLTQLAGKKRNQLDLRPRVGVHHNALHDCIYQIGYVTECYNALQNAKGV
jgi:hypothetical protein